MTPAATALTGARREAALASARMNFAVPDDVPTAELNRIVWHDVKGWSSPYPRLTQAAFSPFQFDDEDESEKD